MRILIEILKKVLILPKKKFLLEADNRVFINNSDNKRYEYNTILTSFIGIFLTIVSSYYLFKVIIIDITDRNFIKISIYVISNYSQNLTLIILGLFANTFILWNAYRKNILVTSIYSDIFYRISIIIAQIMSFIVIPIKKHDSALFLYFNTEILGVDISKFIVAIQTIITITLLYIFDDWNIIKDYIHNSKQLIKQSHFFRIFLANIIILLSLLIAIFIMFLFIGDTNHNFILISWIRLGFIYIGYNLICIFIRSSCSLLIILERTKENEIFLIGRQLTNFSQFLDKIKKNN